jgi:hypothetical protein
MDQHKRLELELALEDRLREDLGALTVRPYAYYKEGAMQRIAARSSVGRMFSFVGAGAALAVALVFVLGFASVLLNLRGPSPATSPAPITVSPSPTTSPTTSPGPTTASSTPPPEFTPPALNRLETKIIDALARLGVSGQRAQLPFQNANIWARFAPGSELFVNAWPTGTDRGEFSVIDERQLAGIRVERVRYTSSPVLRDRFACAGDTYEVSGAVPPGFTDMDAFVAGFIRGLGCGT